MSQKLHLSFIIEHLPLIDHLSFINEAANDQRSTINDQRSISLKGGHQ